MKTTIRVLSVIIIVFGFIHIYFASCRVMDTDTLWFIGTGFAIIFPGLLNLVAIENGGSKLANIIAFVVSGLMCIMFLFALFIMSELQVYLGIAIFLASSIAFLLRMLRGVKQS